MSTSESPQVWIVDDDAAVRDSLCALLMGEGFAAQGFDGARAFLDFAHLGLRGCLVSDVRMPLMSGLELQHALHERGIRIPTIFVTGHGDIPMAVQAVQAGAVDFIEKPFPNQALLDSIGKALAQGADTGLASRQAGARARAALLTERERQVMDLVVAGLSNKEVAQRLGISPRTVDVHRTHVMDKMKADSLPDLVRQAILLE
ncbi:MAG: response regulator [Magnetospirillum sp.]|nr:response regulator [Magnetospirillum sp.]